MNRQIEADQLNRSLEEFYSSKLDAWKQLRTGEAAAAHCLSIPLFLKISEAYLAAQPRIVFVGQETHGWWTEYKEEINTLTSGKIMDFYDTQWVELYRFYKRSPYWQAMRRIAEAFKLTEPPRSFLYSNIFPCDVDKKQAPPALLESFREWKILPRELELLKPDYVVFFCGREYYWNLKTYFGEYPKQFVTKATPLVEYDPPNQLWKGFVTYHPGYLRRSNNWECLDKIIEYIRSDLALKGRVDVSSTTSRALVED
jgi:hypothetical protein